MKTSTVLPVLLVMLTSAQVHAQREIPLISTNIEYTTEAAVRDTNPEVAFSSIRWSIGGLIPIPVNKKTVVVLVPGYRIWRYASSEANDLKVHDLGLLSTVRRQLTTRWALAGTLGVGLATDFNDVDAEHIRISGAVSVELRHGPNLSLGGGVAASYVFGKLLPIPVVSVDWLATDRIYVSVLAPQRARVGFRATPKLDMSVATTIDGNQFSAELGTPLVENINLSRATVRATVSVRAVGNVWLSAYAGRTVFRTLKAFDDSETELADLSLKQSTVLGVTAQFRIPVPR